MEKYGRYKEINLPWLHSIPEHWDVKRNKNVFIECKKLVGENAGDFTLLSLTLKGIIRRDIESGKGKFPKEFDTYKIVESDDMIFCLFDMDETPRTVGVSSQDGMITGAYDVFKVKDANIRYLYYYYLSLDNQKALKPFYTGLRKTIGVPKFLGINLPIPPIEEQNKIVNYLDWQVSKINKWIWAKKDELALLQEQKQVIINNTLTMGLNPETAMKASSVEGVNVIPSDWIVAPLKNFVKSNIESLTNNEDKELEIKYLDISSVGFGLLRAQPVTYSFKDAPSRARRIVHNTDTIISTVRTYLKSMCYVDERISDCIVSTGFAVLSPKGNIHPELLYYMLSSSYFMDQVQRNSVGVSYPAISEPKLLSLKVILPKSYEEQVQIYKFLNREHSIIEQAELAIKQEIKKLIEYKQALIFTIVTGQTDIRDILVPDNEPVPTEEIAEIDEEDNVIELDYGEEE